LEIRTHFGRKGFLVWLSAYPCGERPYIDDLSRQRFVLNDVGNGLAIIGAMLVSLTAPLAGFLYYREYLLGREFMHDLRAVQLMSSAEPMKAFLRTLAEQSSRTGLVVSLQEFRKHFEAFHPLQRKGSEISYYSIPFEIGV
jgi:Zn-dependent protease with chaperone function